MPGPLGIKHAVWSQWGINAMNSHCFQLLLETKAELESLRGPDRIAFAQSIGLYNPANVDGYARLLEREIARLERLADSDPI